MRRVYRQLIINKLNMLSLFSKIWDRETDRETDEVREQFIEDTRAQYRERVQTLMHYQLISDATEPVITDIRGQICRLPCVEEILSLMTQEDRHKIRRLEQPTFGLVPVGLRHAEIVPSGLTPFSSDFEKFDETENLVSWNPADPEHGRSKRERILGDETSFPGWDIIFYDGGPEVPRKTLGKSPLKLHKIWRKNLGYDFLHRDAYLLAFLEASRRNGAWLDQKSQCLLDGYVKSHRALLVGMMGRLDFQFGVPSTGNVKYKPYKDPSQPAPYLGTRRVVHIRSTHS